MTSKILFRQSLTYGIGSIIVNGSTFLLIPVYTRILSPTEYGIIGSVAILSSLITAILGLGLQGSISRFYFDFEDKEEWTVFLGNSIGFLVLFGFIITLLLNVFGNVILDSFFKSVRFDPYLRYGIWIGYLGIIPLIPLALLQAKQQSFKYRLLTTASFVVLTLFMLLLIIGLGQGAIGALRAQLFTGIIMALVYFATIGKVSFRFSYPFLRTSLIYGIPIMFYTIFGVFTELASRYFIERYTDLAQLGVFNLAQQYASIVVLIVTAISLAWTPIFFRLAGKEGSDEIFARFGLTLVAFITGISLVLGLFAPEILTIISPKSYSRAGEIIPVLLLAYVFGNGFWIVLVAPIFYTKKTNYLPVITILSSICGILLNLLLVPAYGLTGAAVALLCSYIILVAAAGIVSSRVFPIRYDLRKVSIILSSAIAVYFLAVLVASNVGSFVLIVKFLAVLAFALILASMRIVSREQLFNMLKNNA